MTTPDSSTPGTRATSGTAAGEERSDADLGDALEQLAALAVGVQSLEVSLEWVAHLTVVAVPGADGAGVTMREAGRPLTVCASDDFVRQVDDVQYGLSEGPCITAADEVRTVIAGRLATDPSWPRFGPRARDLGINSSVSVPMVMPGGEVMGALNVYARGQDVFDDAAALRARSFANAAAVVVHNARALMQAHRLADQLATALESRAVIDQAIGILMSRHGGTPADAFATLRRLSQNQNLKLSTVADGIVREAVTRARARNSRG